MAQYNTLNVRLSNSQFNKLKPGIKNGTEITLKLSSNVVGNSDDQNNFQLHKIGQSGEFLGRLLGRLLKSGLPLMKNVLKPLAKSILVTLGLTAAIQNKMFGSGCPRILALRPSDLALCAMTLAISNEEMNDIMKTVKSLEEFGFLIKGIGKAINP